MKTITLTLFSFEELSKEAQQSAIANLADINTDYDWWDSLYEDAKNVDLILTGFDLDRNAINGHFLHDGEVTALKILTEHGQECDTYKLAKEFMDIIKSEQQDIDFCKRLCACYLTSSAAIEETIISMEYDFLEDGTRYV